MGTRGAYGFRINGTDKVTYNHFDSYPSGLGMDIVRFIQGTPDDELGMIADKLVMVKEDGIPTTGQLAECMQADTVNFGVSTQSPDDWYCLLREAQGDLNAYKGTLRYMIDSGKFLGDSLFCEWAYIINLDTMELEVYEGFNKRFDAPGRYVGKVANNGYFGVGLIATHPLDVVREIDAEKLATLWEPEAE